MKPAWWQQWQARWQAMPAAERQRALLVAALFSVGGYFAFHSLVTAPQLVKARGDLNRLAARAKKSSAAPAPVLPQRSSGKLPAELRQDLQVLDTRLQQQQQHLAELGRRFARLDQLADHQALRLALTELANSADIEVVRLETKGLPKEEQRQVPTPERLRELAQKNVYGRPLLRLEARASYRGLMQFLDGLAGLPHIASPVSVKIEVRTDGNDSTPATRQWLEVGIDLAL